MGHTVLGTSRSGMVSSDAIPASQLASAWFFSPWLKWKVLHFFLPSPSLFHSRSLPFSMEMALQGFHERKQVRPKKDPISTEPDSKDSSAKSQTLYYINKSLRADHDNQWGKTTFVRFYSFHIPCILVPFMIQASGSRVPVFRSSRQFSVRDRASERNRRKYKVMHVHGDPASKKRRTFVKKWENIFHGTRSDDDLFYGEFTFTNSVILRIRK